MSSPNESWLGLLQPQRPNAVGHWQHVFLQCHNAAKTDHSWQERTWKVTRFGTTIERSHLFALAATPRMWELLSWAWQDQWQKPMMQCMWWLALPLQWSCGLSQSLKLIHTPQTPSLSSAESLISDTTCHARWLRQQTNLCLQLTKS